MALYEFTDKDFETVNKAAHLLRLSSEDKKELALMARIIKLLSSVDGFKYSSAFFRGQGEAVVTDYKKFLKQLEAMTTSGTKAYNNSETISSLSMVKCKFQTELMLLNSLQYCYNKKKKSNDKHIDALADSIRPIYNQLALGVVKSYKTLSNFSLTLPSVNVDEKHSDLTSLFNSIYENSGIIVSHISEIEKRESYGGTSLVHGEVGNEKRRKDVYKMYQDYFKSIYNECKSQADRENLNKAIARFPSYLDFFAPNGKPKKNSNGICFSNDGRGEVYPYVENGKNVTRLAGIRTYASFMEFTAEGTLDKGRKDKFREFPNEAAYLRFVNSDAFLNYVQSIENGYAVDTKVFKLPGDKYYDQKAGKNLIIPASSFYDTKAEKLVKLPEGAYYDEKAKRIYCAETVLVPGLIKGYEYKLFSKLRVKGSVYSDLVSATDDFNNVPTIGGRAIFNVEEEDPTLNPIIARLTAGLLVVGALAPYGALAGEMVENLVEAINAEGSGPSGEQETPGEDITRNPDPETKPGTSDTEKRPGGEPSISESTKPVINPVDPEESEQQVEPKPEVTDPGYHGGEVTKPNRPSETNPDGLGGGTETDPNYQGGEVTTEHNTHDGNPAAPIESAPETISAPEITDPNYQGGEVTKPNKQNDKDKVNETNADGLLYY